MTEPLPEVVEVDDRIAEAAEAMVELVKTAGVACSTDGDQLALPGGWLVLTELGPSRLDGETFETVWTLYLIASDSSTGTALRQLGDMFGKVRHLADESTPAEPVVLQLANYSATPLPSIAVNIRTETRPTT